MSPAFGEKEAKKRIRHVMDFKHPRALVVAVAAVVCVAVGILLLTNPGERSNQLEGIRMTNVRVLDQGIPVDLPEDLARQLVPLIREYDKGDYNDLSSYQPAAGDVCLSDQGGGTVYYLTSSLDREPVLVRINHDGYGWTSAFEGLTLAGISEDPSYRVWTAQTEEYLVSGRADDLYDLRTAYIGNHVACGEILKALNVDEVVGPYTLELQTGKEPYGITLHLSNQPTLPEEQERRAGYLHQVGILFTALVDNASFFNWDCISMGQEGKAEDLASGGVQPGLSKPMDRTAFQRLYDRYRAELGRLSSPAMGDTAHYSLGEALYLSEDMAWRDVLGYIGNVTVAPDAFSVQMTHVLSSALPQINDIQANASYRAMEVPDRLLVQISDRQRQAVGEEQTLFPMVDLEQGGIDLAGFGSRTCLAVCDFRGDLTPYRLYELDSELWLSHETSGAADWVFRLSDQPGVSLPGDETEE